MMPLAAEVRVIQGILPHLAFEIAMAFGWAAAYFSGSGVRLTVTSYTMPQVAGARTVERQKLYRKRGKSKWRGKPEDAAHVCREAMHLGLRTTGKNPRYVPWRRHTKLQRELFMAVVRFLEALGWTWGGRWKSKDREHFEKRGSR